jgi:hypothetical protein
MIARQWARRAGLGARRMKHTVRHYFAAALSGLAAVAALAPTAAAQCAMCYQSAAAGGDRSRVALQHGILILLIPSVGLFVGIFGLIYSRRNVSR